MPIKAIIAIIFVAIMVVYSVRVELKRKARGESGDSWSGDGDSHHDGHHGDSGHDGGGGGGHH